MVYARYFIKRWGDDTRMSKHYNKPNIQPKNYNKTKPNRKTTQTIKKPTQKLLFPTDTIDTITQKLNKLPKKELTELKEQCKKEDINLSFYVKSTETYYCLVSLKMYCHYQEVAPEPNEHFYMCRKYQNLNKKKK